MNGTGGIRKNGTVEMNGNGSNKKKNPSNAVVLWLELTGDGGL